MSTTSEIIHVPQRGVTVSEDDFMPILSVQKAVERKGMMNEFINKVLKEGDDYGKMPGDSRTDAKKVLFKPGAEKLCSIFGMAPQYLEDKIVEDWTGNDHDGEPLFYYSYRCQLMRGDRFMGEAIGSCNSWEVKYRYRWVPEAQIPDGITPSATKGGKAFEFQFAIEKAETSGQYGKPAEYWQRYRNAIEDGTAEPSQKETKSGKKLPGWLIDQTLYRIPNPDVADIINTLQKMAQKRALVAAVLVVTNCSDAFTQDVEDFGEAPIVPNGGDPGHVAQPPTTAPASGKGGMPEAFAQMKELLGDKLYNFTLKAWDVTDPSQLDREPAKVLYKQMGIAKKVVTAASHGEVLPEMNPVIFNCLPDSSVAAIILEYQNKLESLAGSTVGVAEFDEARKNAADNWELVNDLQKRINSLAKLQGLA